MWELIAPVDADVFEIKMLYTSDSCFDGKQSGASSPHSDAAVLGRPRVSSGGVSGKHCVDTHFSYARKKSSISQKSVMIFIGELLLVERNETLSLHYTKRVLFIQKLFNYLSNSRKEPKKGVANVMPFFFSQIIKIRNK